MCEHCRAIDARLARFRRAFDPALDPQTLLKLRLAIEALIAHKAALHPNE